MCFYGRLTPALALILFALPLAAASNCEQLRTLSTPAATILIAETVGSHTFQPPKGKAIENLPVFCRVAAELHPSADAKIRVELWMPVEKWNGRFEGTGNGGFAGGLAYPSLASGVRQGYAVANTDMGMQTAPGETAMAFTGRPERWKDWGYRATHEMTVQSKRWVQLFYGSQVKRSYFTGCSTGGEQGWMEAQKYPDDYDGIVSGAPANNRTGVHMSILWNYIVSQQTPGGILPQAKLALLSQSVLKACDRLDGLEDGILSAPQKCTFDPKTLACSGGNAANCLTPAELSTVQRLYSGPGNPRTGESIYPGLPKGTEQWWGRLGPDAAGLPPYAPIFAWAFGGGWTWQQFNFDSGAALFTNRLGGMLNAMNPDLRTFRDRGHKLLVYHGWADWLVVPEESIRFREMVAKGPAGRNMDTYYRLFMVPGMTHCSGGVGPDHFDALTAVVDWVENGTAPRRLIASQSADSAKSSAATRTRPLCPYPQVAKYNGRGSTADAASFACAAP